MIWMLILKLIIVIVFLIQFWRRPSWAWGVGLLTVTTAILLDTFMGTFNQDDVLSRLGFFYYPLLGLLIGGAFYWLTSLLRPLQEAGAVIPAPAPASPTPQFTPGTGAEGTAYDRQMIYEEIRQRLSYEDILDLLFDLQADELAVMQVGQTYADLVVSLMEWTAVNNKTGALALAVERILTPPAPEMLPRREKITPDSPPTILRHFLLTHYDLVTLQKLVISMGLDWEQLSVGSKKSKVRDFLYHLYRRDRIGELIARLQEEETAVTPPAA